MAWLWLGGALLLGSTLLIVAVTVDRRVLRRNSRAAVVASTRGNDAVDAYVPTYVTQAQIDALPGIPGSRQAPRGRRFDAKLAHRCLLPEHGRAHIDQPRLLLVDGTVDAMRQLLPALGDRQALVVIAREISEEVAETVEANRKQFAWPLLVLVASSEELHRIQQETGQQVLTPDDLRAGYVPAEAYAATARVDADAQHAWIDVQ